MCILFTIHRKSFDIHGVGNYGDLAFRNAARDKIAAQALADGRNRIRLVDHVGLQGTGQSIAQSPFLTGAMVHGRILPEGADLVDHGDTKLPPGPDGGHSVQRRGVGMQDVRPYSRDNFPQAIKGRLDHSPLIEEG